MLKRMSKHTVHSTEAQNRGCLFNQPPRISDVAIVYCQICIPVCILTENQSIVCFIYNFIFLDIIINVLYYNLPSKLNKYDLSNFHMVTFYESKILGLYYSIIIFLRKCDIYLIIHNSYHVGNSILVGFCIGHIEYNRV